MDQPRPDRSIDPDYISDRHSEPAAASFSAVTPPFISPSPHRHAFSRTQELDMHQDMQPDMDLNMEMDLSMDMHPEPDPGSREFDQLDRLAMGRFGWDGFEGVGNGNGNGNGVVEDWLAVGTERGMTGNQDAQGTHATQGEHGTEGTEREERTNDEALGLGLGLFDHLPGQPEEAVDLQGRIYSLGFPCQSVRPANQGGHAVHTGQAGHDAPPLPASSTSTSMGLNPLHPPPQLTPNPFPYSHSHPPPNHTTNQQNISPLSPLPPAFAPKDPGLFSFSTIAPVLGLGGGEGLGGTSILGIVEGFQEGWAGMDAGGGLMSGMNGVGTGLGMDLDMGDLNRTLDLDHLARSHFHTHSHAPAHAHTQVQAGRGPRLTLDIPWARPEGTIENLLPLPTHAQEHPGLDGSRYSRERKSTETFSAGSSPWSPLTGSGLGRRSYHGNPAGIEDERFSAYPDQNRSGLDADEDRSNTDQRYSQQTPTQTTCSPSSFPQTPATGVTGNSNNVPPLSGLSLRSRASSSSIVNGQLGWGKPYERYPSGRFLTTVAAAMGKGRDEVQGYEVLADSQVYRLGSREAGVGSRSGSRSKREGRRRSRSGSFQGFGFGPEPRLTKNAMMTMGDLSATTLSPNESMGMEERIDSPRSNEWEVDLLDEHGKSLDLIEREKVYEIKLGSLTRRVKGATTTKGQECEKMRWTKLWLQANYTVSPECTVAKQALYEGYESSTRKHGFHPARKAVVNKILAQLFPKIYMRRLGTRQTSRYHYCGIQPVTQAQCQALNLYNEANGCANGLLYQIPSESSTERDRQNEAFVSEQNGGRKTTIATLPSPSVSLQANSHGQRSASSSSRKETFSAPARSQTFAIVPYSEDPLETVDQTASTCRVETFDGYPTLEVFKIYMQAYFAETLWTSVKNHLNGVLESLENWDIKKLGHDITSFWSEIPSAIRPYLQVEAVSALIFKCEMLLWEEALGFLVSHAVASMPERASVEIRELGKTLSNLPNTAAAGYDVRLYKTFIDDRVALALSIGHLLTRFTDLCHTSTVIKRLFQQTGLLENILTTWKGLDWNLLLIQSHMMLGISAKAIKESIIDPFEELLQQASEISRPEDAGEAVLEDFSNWLQDMICSLLEEGLDGVKIRPKQIVFVTTWLTSEITRELTNKSSDMFGVFQLFKVWVDDFVAFFVQRKTCLRKSE